MLARSVDSDCQRCVLSLESCVKYQGLCFSLCRDNTEAAVRVSCGGLVGVGDHIRDRRGNRGNTGEPTVSTRTIAAQGQPRDQKTGLRRKLAAPVVMEKKSSKR